MGKNNLLLAGMFATLGLVNAASTRTNRRRSPEILFGCCKKVSKTAPFVDKPYRGCRR